jgi:glycosyltransferase involved in cell wall biosynthesis
MLTLITITYNAEAVLERTLKSVANQTVQGFEYLLIDGASKDGTLAVAEKYNCITKIVSEPDKGIYDAMNKGLALAKGEYVWFMNAGDELFDNQVVERFLVKSKEQADVYYGETQFVKDDGTAVGWRSEVTPHRLPQKLTWQSMRYGMVVCHQAFIVRKRIAPTYTLDHFYSADIDWEIRCLKASKKAVLLNFPIAKYLTGGFSIKNLKKSWWDRYAILRNHFGFWGAVWSHVIIILRGLLFALKKGGKYW